MSNLTGCSSKHAGSSSLISHFTIASDGREYLRVGSVELRAVDKEAFAVEPCRKKWDRTMVSQCLVSCKGRAQLSRQSHLHNLWHACFVSVGPVDIHQVTDIQFMEAWEDSLMCEQHQKRRFDW